jgi:hypothetical protein
MSDIYENHLSYSLHVKTHALILGSLVIVSRKCDETAARFQVR